MRSKGFQRLYQLMCLARSWPLRLVRVQGQSMSPALRSGDVLLLGAPLDARPARGQVVEVLDPRDGRRLIKRVIREGEGEFWVQGDHAAASRDSRHFGPLPRAAWVGVAWILIGVEPLRVRWLGSTRRVGQVV